MNDSVKHSYKCKQNNYYCCSNNKIYNFIYETLCFRLYCTRVTEGNISND